MRPSRDASFDILKGIGILLVVGLHVSNFSARHFAAEYGWGWWLLTILNRLANVGVPLFLLISSVLWARSRNKSGGSWTSFILRRLEGLLWPYLVWSGLYIAARYARTDPSQILAPERLNEILLGKAMYHLYFLVILLSFLIAFPLVYAGLDTLRRRVPRASAGFLIALVLGVLLQGAAFFVQTLVRFAYPATLFPWYLVTLIPGVWIGMTFDEWGSVGRRLRLPITFLFFVFMGFFLWVAVRVILELPYTSFEFNSAQKLATTFGALLLLSFAIGWKAASTALRKFLNALGERSLAIYLFHPLLLTLMGGPRVLRLLDQLPLSPLIVFLAVLGIAYAFAVFCERTRLDRPLFGKGPWPFSGRVASTPQN